MILNSPYITGSITVTGNANVQGTLTVTGSLSGTATSASLALNSNLLQGTGSVGFATTGAFSATSGSASSRLTQIEQVYATTGSNSFRATQSITGSLTVTGQIIAQTINVQQVTSSIVFSSGSNVFGNQLANRQTFTGSVNITGSLALAGNDMTITSTVIGPMFILDNANVNGYSQIQFKGDTKDAYIFKPNSNYTNYGGPNSLNFYTDTVSGGGFSFNPRASENAVFIDPAGNLGIGVGTTVGAKLDIAGGNARITSTQNGFGGISTINPSTGTSAYSGLIVGNNIATTGGGFLMLGGNFPTSGPYTSNGAYAFGNQAGGLTIAAEVGTLKFVTGTTIKATMAADGNLGLNETAPTNLLHLSGVSATPSLRLASTSTGFYWDIGRENQTTGDFIFNYKTPSTSTTEWVRITTLGLFGIGVTPSGTYGKLTVAGGIRTTADSLSKLEIGRYNSGNPDSYIKLGSSSNGLVISNAADSADLFYLKNSGRFGIGISPTTVLEVVGSNAGNALTKMQNTDTAGYSGIDFFRQGGAHAGSVWCANDTAGATNNRNALTISARVPGEKLILVGGGYDPVVDGGLTITGSNTKLQGNNAYHMINSTAGLYAYLFLNNDAGGAGSERTAYFIQNTAGQTSNGVAAGAAYLYFGQTQNMEFVWAGVSKASITSAGVFNSVGGGTSDLRTKQDIDYDFDNGVDSIIKLQPTKFKFKNSPDKQRRGFIAQDVLETIPDLVLGNGEVEGGTYGLDYDGVLAIAVKAIQELKAEIEELKNK
jgi:hypothetical protein